MTQYLDAAIKAACAAGALFRENFGRPPKSMSKKLTISSWSLMFAPKRSSRTTKQGTRRANQYPQGRVRHLRASQLQIPHKPKNGEVRKGTAVRFDLSKGAGTIPLP
jgi:hypothetical protein